MKKKFLKIFHKKINFILSLFILFSSLIFASFYISHTIQSHAEAVTYLSKTNFKNINQITNPNNIGEKIVGYMIRTECINGHCRSIKKKLNKREAKKIEKDIKKEQEKIEKQMREIERYIQQIQLPFLSFFSQDNGGWK